MEQTVYLGTTTTDVVVYTQAIDSSGIHVALVVNTSTSKLVFADGTVSSATPTVASLGTGKAKVTFASIANSSLSAGDTVAVRINGTASGTTFSEYLIPVFIATASSGGGGGGLTQADVRSAVGLASANLDTQLGDIPTVSEFNARTKPTADYFDHTTDQVTTDSASRTASQANVSGLSTFNAASDTVDVGKINGNATSASNLQKSTSQMIQGTVTNTPTGPVTQIGITSFYVSDITHSEEDTFIGRLIIFTSGNLVGQSTDITDYALHSSSGNGFFKVTGTTQPPANNDTFIIV